MTDCGFCVVAALSSQTSGRPWTRSLQDREVALDDVRVERCRRARRSDRGRPRVESRRRGLAGRPGTARRESVRRVVCVRGGWAQVSAMGPERGGAAPVDTGSRRSGAGEARPGTPPASPRARGSTAVGRPDPTALASASGERPELSASSAGSARRSLSLGDRASRRAAAVHRPGTGGSGHRGRRPSAPTLSAFGPGLRRRDRARDDGATGGEGAMTGGAFRRWLASRSISAQCLPRGRAARRPGVAQAGRRAHLYSW
jgi:hypothetical protein